MTLRRPEITLSENDLLTSGGGRKIFAHPTRPDVVIKLHKPLRVKNLQWLRSLMRPKRRRFDAILNSVVEIDELAAMVGRTGKVPDFAAQFLGFVATNLGAGAMFEAIKGPDGALAITLAKHARDHGPDPAMAAAIDQFWDDVTKFRAVVSDPALRNIVVTGDAQQGYRLTIVDGLGERTLIPIQTISNMIYAARSKAARAAMHRNYHAAAQQR